jgi:DNA-directed RNA polymerase specialized sigma24 family protein
MRDDAVVIDLVTRARHGDQQAWNTLVERYAPLMWSICRRYRLSRADTDDVSQTVWLRQALTSLPPACQQLLAMLTEDPPVPYAQISAWLGIPVGSIGPTRQRCLQKLRDHPAVAALIDPALPGAIRVS